MTCCCVTSGGLSALNGGIISHQNRKECMSMFVWFDGIFGKFHQIVDHQLVSTSSRLFPCVQNLSRFWHLDFLVLQHTDLLFIQVVFCHSACETWWHAFPQIVFSVTEINVLAYASSTGDWWSSVQRSSKQYRRVGGKENTI